MMANDEEEHCLIRSGEMWGVGRGDERDGMKPLVVSVGLCLKHSPIQQYGHSNRFDLKCLAEEGGELRHDGLHGREACSHTTPT